MLKFGMEIDYGVIQKHYTAIFEILNFHDFSGGQSSNFRHSDKILDFDHLKSCEKSKFQKSPHNVFVSPQNLSPNQVSASADL